MHDGLKGYRELSGVGHALCNAHHLRELKALIEFDGEPWAEPMRDLLLEANRAVERGPRTGPNGLRVRRLTRLQGALLGTAAGRPRPSPQAAAPAKTCLKRADAKRRPGHNLLIRLHKFKDDVLRFLVDFAVPFTNNLAEQALRMMKVKMKISGAFRTLDAASRLRRPPIGRRLRPKARLEHPPNHHRPTSPLIQALNA